jgi:hypothetical protein
MKPVYEYGRFTKISTKLLFKRRFLVKDGCVGGPARQRDLLSGFQGQLLGSPPPVTPAAPGRVILDEHPSNRHGHVWHAGTVQTLHDAQKRIIPFPTLLFPMFQTFI